MDVNRFVKFLPFYAGISKLPIRVLASARKPCGCNKAQLHPTSWCFLVFFYSMLPLVTLCYLHLFSLSVSWNFVFLLCRFYQTICWSLDILIKLVMIIHLFFTLSGFLGACGILLLKPALLKVVSIDLFRLFVLVKSSKRFNSSKKPWFWSFFAVFCPDVIVAPVGACVGRLYVCRER